MSQTNSFVGIGAKEDDNIYESLCNLTNDKLWLYLFAVNTYHINTKYSSEVIQLSIALMFNPITIKNFKKSNSEEVF